MTAGPRAPRFVLASASPRRLDLLREALGDAPSEWFPALTGTRWPGGANDEGEAGVEALRLAAE